MNNIPIHILVAIFAISFHCIPRAALSRQITSKLVLISCKYSYALTFFLILLFSRHTLMYFIFPVTINCIQGSHLVKYLVLPWRLEQLLLHQDTDLFYFPGHIFITSPTHLMFPKFSLIFYLDCGSKNIMANNTTELQNITLKTNINIF